LKTKSKKPEKKKQINQPALNLSGVKFEDGFVAIFQGKFHQFRLFRVSRWFYVAWIYLGLLKIQSRNSIPHEYVVDNFYETDIKV